MTDTAQPIRVAKDGSAQGLNGGNSDQNTEQINGHATLSTDSLQSQSTSKPLHLAPEELKTQANGDGLNGNTNRPSQPQKVDVFDPNFTQNVINAMGPKTSPRLRQVMASLIRHIHDFARENEITIDEWMAGLEMVNLLIPATATSAPAHIRTV